MSGFASLPLDMIDPTDEGHCDISRTLSEETDESPFASNLVTPTDEDTYPIGIQGRLEAAHSALSYFASKDSTSYLEQKEPITSAFSQVDNQHGSHDGKEVICSPLIHTLESSETISSSISSDSSREAAPPTASIYNLPNDHINVSQSPDVIQNDIAQPLFGSDSCHVIRQPDLGCTFWMKECKTFIDSLTFRAILSISLRLLFFLPWCAAVGGALVLSPEHLEFIAFRPGYIESLSGIRRHAYWAEYGYQHIIIFFGALLVLIWSYPTVGFVILGGILAQFCMAWHTFLLDRNIPLGHDDQQSVFLLATTSWFNDTPVGIHKIGGSYYSTDYRGKNCLSGYDQEKICAQETQAPEIRTSANRFN